MQPFVNIFELRDLPAHRSNDRGFVKFVFIICIVQVVGIKLKIQPILSMSLSSWSFHVCHFKLRVGGCLAQRWRFDLALGDSMLRNFVIL